MAQPMSKKITIDFEAGKSLDNILKSLQGVGKNAKNIKIDEATMKQLNAVTHKIEDLEKRINEVEKKGISTEQFKTFADSVISLIGDINTEFDSMYGKIEKVLDPNLLSQFSGEIRNLQVDTQKTTGQIIQGLNNVEGVVENIVKDETVAAAKVNAMTKQVVSEQVSGSKKRADAEKQVTKEMQKQEETQKKINQEKDKSNSKSSKKYKTDANADEFVKVDFQLPENAEQDLKDTVASIVNSINETNPTVEVRVAFVSNYKTRRRQEIIEQLNKDLDEVYKFPPKTKKKQEEFYGIVEDARAQFMKELSKDSLSLDFESNITKLREEIPITMQAIKDALGEIELDANVKISKQQVEEQLGELHNFTLTINDVAFSPDFLTKIDGLSSLLEEQEKKAQEAQPETGVDKDQMQKLADLIAQAKKVNEIIKSIGERIGAVPLKGEFDKDQLQESLNSITGLTLKIAELDVSNIKGVGTGAGIVINGYAPNGTYSGEGNSSTPPTDNGANKTNEQIANNEEKIAYTLEDFVKAVDEFANFNKKKDSGEFKNDKAVESFVKKFISGDIAKKYGYNLSDWLANTTKLGDEQNKAYNTKLIEDKYGNRLLFTKPSTAQDASKKAEEELQQALATAKVTNDKLEILNTDIRNYVKQLKVPVDQLGKTLKERLDEVNSVDDYLKVGKTYSAQKKVKEEREELLGSIITRLSTMPPAEYNDMITAGSNGQYSYLWKFIQHLQTENPEAWGRIEKRREDVVAEEIKRLVGRIEKDRDGKFLSSEKNSKAIDALAQYLFTARFYGSKNGPTSWAAIARDNNISSKDMTTIKQSVKDNSPLGYVNMLERKTPLLQATEEDIDSFIKEFKLSEEMAKSFKEILKQRIEKLQAEEKAKNKKKEEEEKNKPKARQKTAGEISKSQQAKKPIETEKTKPSETLQIERRIGYDSIFSDLQYLAQRAGMPIDLGMSPKEDSVEEIDKQLTVYYAKLAEIEELRAKVNEFKDKVKAETGEELTNEQVFKEIFPGSPVNVQAGLRDLQNYEVLYKEAERLVDAQKELAKKKESIPKQPVSQVKAFNFSQEQLDSIEGLTNAIVVDEHGNIAKGKQNTASLTEVTKLINSYVKTEKGSTFDINSIRDKLNVPGVEKFITALREERKNNRALLEEFEKITYQMSRVDEKSDEYQALSVKKEDVQKRLDESTSKMNGIISEQGKYTDAFFEGINNAYRKKYVKAGQDAVEGYNEGAESKKAETEKTTADIMKAGIEAAKNAQKSHSPSEEYYQLGVWAIEGYNEAIKARLPQIKELASQIKITSDGMLDTSVENIKKVNELSRELKADKARKVTYHNPLNTWQDTEGNKHLGLRDLYNNINKTPSNNISLAKDNMQNIKAFATQYMSAFEYNKEAFNSVMKVIGADEKQSSSLWKQVVAFANERHKQNNVELKSLIDNLERNSDKKTISKKMDKNGAKISELYDRYANTRRGAIDENGLNKDAYNTFAKAMGLSEDNAQRIWDMFQKIYAQRANQIESLRQQQLDSINDVKKAEEDAETDTSQEEIKNTEKASEENQKALKDEQKERAKIIKQIETIIKKTKYLSSFKQEGKTIIDELNNGAPLNIGQDYIDKAPDPYNQVGTNRYYYDILKRANRLASSNIANPEIKAQADAIAESLRQLDPAAEKSLGVLKEFDDELRGFEAESERAGKTFVSAVVERLKKANADFFARYLSIRDIIRYFNTLRQTVTEYDTALTEMRKVSDESIKSLKEYQKSTFEVADALGTTALQLQQTTADWLRLGESMEEASESAKVATTLLNVSEFENINDATTALVAMSQAYKDMDKTEIIDVLNNIGNNYSIATDQLATALQASSSALMTQGNNLYEAAALVTAGNAVIQDASKVGTGIRTISLRIAGQKLDKEELEKELDELGEEVDDFVVQTESKKRQVIMEYTRVASNNYQGVDILDPNGNLKNTYQIMLEISKIYKEIQEEDKKYGTNRAQGLVEELAGKVRSNIAASILMNPQMLENVYNSAINSAGSAAEENAKYLDSIVGRTEQLKNEWQELQTSILNSSLLKDLLSLAKGFLSLINQLLKAMPMLPGLLAAVAAGIFGINKQLFITKEQTLGVIPQLIKTVIVYLKGLIGAEVTQTEAAMAAATATNSLNAALTMGGSLLIMGALWGISKLIQREQQLATEAQEARDAIHELNSELRNTIDTVDDVGEKYAKMSQSVANLGQINQSQGSLSNDEYKEFLDISNQLADLFPQLRVGITDNGDAILDLNGSVETIVGNLEKLVEVEKDLARQEMLDNADKVLKEDNRKYKKAAKVIENNEKLLQHEDELFNKLLAKEKGVSASQYDDIINADFMNDLFENAYGGWEGVKKKHEFEISDGLFDFSNLGDDDINKLKRAFANMRTTLENEISNTNVEIDKYNADLRNNLNAYILTYASDDVSAQLESAVIKSFKFSDIPESVRNQGWDEITTWFETNYFSAIESIDDEELKQKMVDVLNNTNLSAVQKTNIIQEIMDSLTEEGYTEKNPITIFWQSQYVGARDASNAVTERILSGMSYSTPAERNLQAARAKHFAEMLTDAQLKRLDEISISPNTINSFEDLIDLLEIATEDVSHFTDIGALLSQSTEVRTNQLLHDLEADYDYEIALAKEKGAELERTIYGNVDLNNRQVLKWKPYQMDKYREAVASWGEDVKDYADSISTVDGNYDVINDIRLAFTPMLQTDHGAVYLDRDTVYKYLNQITSQLPDEWRDEDLLKLDAEGLEIEGQHIKGLIAGIGDEALRVSETMHFLGTDGSLALLQRKMEEANQYTVTWENVRDDLIGLAQSGKLDEESFKNYKYFTDIIDALGISVEDADEQIQQMINDINRFAANGVIDRYATAKGSFDKLNEVYKKYRAGEFIDASSLNEIQDEFAYLGDAYRDFENAVMTGVDDLQPYFDRIATEYTAQEYLLGKVTEDTKEWTKQNLINLGVTEKSAEEATNLAVANRKAMESGLLQQIKDLNEGVAISERSAVANAQTLKDVSTDSIKSLIAETMAREDYDEELQNNVQNIALFTLEKSFAAGMDLTNNADFEYLYDLIEATGLATDAVIGLMRAKQAEKELSYYAAQEEEFYKFYGTDKSKWGAAGWKAYSAWAIPSQQLQKEIDKVSDATAEQAQRDITEAARKNNPNLSIGLDWEGIADDASGGAESFKETLDKILALYDAELDAGVIAFQEYVNKSRAIIEQYYREGKITAAEYYDYLASFYEKQVKEYDRVIQAVQDLIEEQIEQLEEQKTKIEESYNEQIEVIQKKIDSLQEENEEIDKNIALQKAQ